MRVVFVVASVAVVAVALSGCMSSPPSPALAPANLQMTLDVDAARMAQGGLAGTLTFTNSGGQTTWLYPFDPCYDTDARITDNGAPVGPDQSAACGRRRAYTDTDLIKVDAGASVDLPFSVLGHYPLQRGHTYQVEITYQPHTMPDDDLSVTHWSVPLVASKTVRIP